MKITGGRLRVKELLDGEKADQLRLYSGVKFDTAERVPAGGVCAVTGLTFLGGAYMAEALRSGLEAVDRAQTESGMCIGLTTLQNLRFVILPQALATSIPAIGANAIFLIKETSVFSAVALADLMYVAKDLIGMYYKTDEALLMLTVAYLTLLLPLRAQQPEDGVARHAVKFNLLSPMALTIDVNYEYRIANRSAVAFDLGGNLKALGGEWRVGVYGSNY